MSAGAWKKLRKLAPQFRGAENEAVTLGQALERLIDAYLDGRKQSKAPAARKGLPMPKASSDSLFPEGTSVTGKPAPKTARY
jgi:hypothetical protein